MRPLTIPVALLITLLAVEARAHTVAVCQDRGPGSTKKAAPTVATFLDHMAVSIGAEPGLFQGAYFTSRSKCDAYARENGAVFGVLDTDTLLAHASDWKVEPIGHLGSDKAKTWHVVVRKGSLQGPAELAGRSIQSTAPGGARFVSSLVLGGAVKPGDLQLKGTAKPLKALRNVAREKADAAIVDQDAVEALGDLELPVELVVLTSSEPLPGLTMAVIQAGGQAPPTPLIKRVRAALPKLCQGAGQKLCKTLGVKGFQAASSATWKRLQKRY